MHMIDLVSLSYLLENEIKWRKTNKLQKKKKETRSKKKNPNP